MRPDARHLLGRAASGPGAALCAPRSTVALRGLGRAFGADLADRRAAVVRLELADRRGQRARRLFDAGDLDRAVRSRAGLLDPAQLRNDARLEGPDRLVVGADGR